MMRPAETVPVGLAVIEGEPMAKLRGSGVEEIGKTILREAVTAPEGASE
jgi:hypothetical protein